MDHQSANKSLYVGNLVSGPASIQECTDNRRVLCANVVLDRPPEAVGQRIANKIYDMCRADQLKLVGFPQFGPVLETIQNLKPETTEKSFQVCVRRGGRLVPLQSFAAKWLDTEFKDATMEELENHNKQFNLDGEFWVEERPDIRFGLTFET